MPQHRVPTEDRLWSRTRKTDECWLWEGPLNRTGYGTIRPSGTRKTVTVHRVSYELAYGQIPDGSMVLHRCDVRNCVRPEHLYLGDAKQNYADMKERGRLPSHHNAAKTHCPQGHEYTPENTRIGSNGGRNCRECHRAASLRWWKAQSR